MKQSMKGCMFESARKSFGLGYLQEVSGLYKQGQRSQTQKHLGMPERYV